MRRIWLYMVIALLAIAPPLTAAPTGNLYEIEVVVFENRTPGLDGGELWSREQNKTADTDMKDAVIAGETPPLTSSLSSAAALLKKSGKHNVLVHLSWQQSADAKSVSRPVKIVNNESGLDGALRFYLSRFLLVDVDLILKETMSAGLFGAQEAEVLSHRLAERRRVKLAETHYFDHPKFGALVRVSPVK